MSAPIYESMTRLQVGRWAIRVWRAEERRGAWDNNDLLGWAEMTDRHVRDSICTFNPEAMDELLAEIEKFPRVSAIEVVDEEGHGALSYPQGWP